MSKPASYTFSWRSIAISAFGPTFLFGMAEGAILPVIALSAKQLGASISLAAFVVTLLGIGALLSNLPAAALATRYGERRAMMGGAIFCAATLLICLAAGHVFWFALGVFLFGMGSSVFLLARHTFLTEAVPLTYRARALSTLGGCMRAGMFIGPFCGAGLMHYLGLSGAYWIAIITMLGAGLLAYTVPDLPSLQSSLKPGQKRPRLLTTLRTHWQTYATLGTACALVNALRACRQVIVPLWALHIGLDAATTAMVYGLMGAMDMLLFYPAGRLMDVRGRRWAAIPSMLLMGAGFALMIASTTLVPFIVACMLVGLGNGLGAGIIMTIGADLSPANARTQFLGGWRVLNDIGSSGGPILVSTLAAVASLATGMGLIAATGFLAAALFWRWLPTGNQPAGTPVRPQHTPHKHP